MIKEEIRLQHEKEFEEVNSKPLTICSGTFYIGNRKRTIVCRNCQKCSKNKRYRQLTMDLPKVKFRHVESFRRCELYKQVINEDYIRIVSTFCVLFSNDLACNYVIELLDDIKYKDKESRRLFNAMVKRVNEYEKKIKESINSIVNVNSLANFNDLMSDNVIPIVEELKLLVLNEFEKNNVEDAEYLSKVEIARTMIGYSVASIKTRIKEGAMFGVDLLSLQDYSLVSLKKVSEEFSNWAERKIENINLGTEKYIEIFKRIDKKITSAKVLSMSIEQTINNIKYQ